MALIPFWLLSLAIPTIRMQNPILRRPANWMQPAGEVIEDRDTQITFSALGQDATPEDKYAWDPDNEKKLAIRDLCQKK